MFYHVKDYLRECRDLFRQTYQLNLNLDHPVFEGKKQDILDIVRRQFPVIKKNVECPHYGSDVLALTNALLHQHILGHQGVLVEAGCFKGGLTAKISHICHCLGLKMICYDSFCGMPPNDENNIQSIFGRPMLNEYIEGEYCSSLAQTRTNVEIFGRPEVVEFRQGFFSESLSQHTEEVAVLYIDVDLAQSTREVLTGIYQFVSDGGIIMSQDCHIPRVLELFSSKEFWVTDLGIDPPSINGLNKNRICWFTK